MMGEQLDQLTTWWESEPSLWEMAQETILDRPIPATNPQPKGIMAAMAVPAVDLGTPKLKVSLWGPAERLTLSLLKTDVWDRRRAAWEPTVTLADIHQGAFAPRIPCVTAINGYPGADGKETEDPYTSWSAAPFPCPKPVGQVILSCADVAGMDDPWASINCGDGAACVSLHREHAALEVTYLPMMARNLLAVSFVGQGLKTPVSCRLYRHRDTVGDLPGEGNGPLDPPKSGAEGRFFWIRQRLPAEKTFPTGFEYILMGLIVGAEVHMETANNQTGLGTPAALTAADIEAIKRQNGDDTITSWAKPKYEVSNGAPGSAATATFSAPEGVVLITVVTTAEAADPVAEARQRLLAAERLGLPALTAENADWYRALYERREHGRVFGASPEWSRRQIPQLFKSWRFVEVSWRPSPAADGEDTDWGGWLCCPDPGAYEADESYVRFEEDTGLFHGLPCYNEIYATSYFVLNQSERLAYWPNLINFWLEAARRNARETFGLPGMFLAHGYQPPIKADVFSHTTAVWEFCMEIPAQVLKPAWDTWDYNGDTDYLAMQVYPALRDLAEFYTAFVTREEDGVYHVVPTVSAEHWGWTYHFERNRDSTSALGMIKWTLNRAVAAAELLGRDADRLDRWRQVAGALAPYPTWETPEGPIFTDVAGVNPLGFTYNFFAGVMPTLLADDIHLDSDPATREMMLRTARLTRGWQNAIVHHLLGAEPEVLKGGLGGVYFPDIPDRPIATPDQLLDALVAEPERLLNSRSSRLHLFPCVPAWATIAFRDFQARGGFLVSAVYAEGCTRFVEIHARRTGTCPVMHPWPGQSVRICDLQQDKEVPYHLDTTNSACLVFAAQQEHTYQITLSTCCQG